RTTRNDDAPGEGDFGGWNFTGPHLGIHAEIADPAGFEMAILPARVQDDNLGLGRRARGDRLRSAHLPATPAGRWPFMRCTITFFAPCANSCALGMSSTARMTSGSVFANT